MRDTAVFFEQSKDPTYLGSNLFSILAFKRAAHTADFGVDAVLDVLRQLVLVLPQAALCAVNQGLGLILGFNGCFPLKTRQSRQS